MKDYTTLQEMYESNDFQAFISDRLGNDLFINDEDRANRIQEYAEDGANGSMHCEVIDDWRVFLNSLSVFDPEFNDPEELNDYDIHINTYNSIEESINQCEQWHENNGSLYTIIN